MICQQTKNAIDDIFFGTAIGTREDALRLLNGENPKLLKHLEKCETCTADLDAHLYQEEVYASIPPY